MPESELICRDCGTAFVFTEAEQEYFRAQGFTHPPKRCKACRARNRRGSAARTGRAHGTRPETAVARFAGGDAAPPMAVAERSEAERPQAAPPDDPRPVRPPRTWTGPTYAAVCSVCGETTQVPFVPDGVRPVFCLPCLKKRTR